MSESVTNESGAAARPRVSPFCKHIASKKMMLSSDPPMTEGDILDASNYCWCTRTQEILGPDSYKCEPSECADKSRSCFESPFSDLL